MESEQKKKLWGTKSGEKSWVFVCVLHADGLPTRIRGLSKDSKMGPMEHKVVN